MSARRTSVAVLLLLLLASGCMLQGGPQGAATVHVHEKRTEGTWGGHLTAAVDLSEMGLPWYLPPHIGVELSERNEHRHGSSLLGGMQLGRTSSGDYVRFGAHLDLGMALGWSAAPAWYIGPTLELPIRLGRAPELGERNRNYRVLGSAPWLVPFFTYRFYRTEPTPLFGRRDSLHELGGGLALRMSYETDFL
jgi:hypothetical protein